MSIYHCSIKVVSRAGGRSAVASAAYRAGEKLHNEETGLTHDFTHKGGVVMNEVILPDNAPRRYLDREVLWNEVQQIEKRSDAQFAREVEVALPNEMTREQQIECVRSFIQDNFIKEGMIAEKQKTVFANGRDEKGRAIYDPTKPSYDPKRKEETSQYRIPQLDKDGKQKVRVRKGKGTEYLWEKITVPENDWNDHSKAEIWRASWAEHCNRYLAKDKQIDHRSYARQGRDQVPTIHEGVVARQMEAEGKTADRCQINREIRERNSIKQQIREIAGEITKLITEKARSIYGRFEKLRRALGDPEGARADAGHSGTSAAGDRFSARAAGRIAEVKRAADDTEQAIARTDKRIIELKAMIKEVKDNIYERFERLKARRAAFRYGEYAGSAGEAAYATGNAAHGELQSTQDSIGSFLRELDAKERASEEKRHDSIAEQETERSGLEGREAELDEREAEIKRKEGDLVTEIETEATKRIFDVRYKLNEEYKRKEEHIWHMSQLREQATADKYKKLTIRYQAEFTILLFYGVIVTALQVIATPKLMEGAMQLMAYWFQALVDFDSNVIGFGHKVANISSLIPNPTASSIVFWVLLILISVIVIGIVYLTIYSVIILYVRYLKANQFDRYTVIAAITALAFTIFLANVIKGIAPINLFAIPIGLFLAYSGIRALVVSRR